MTLYEFSKIASRIGVNRRILVALADGARYEAKLQNEEGVWYICQNFTSGSSCKNKLGFAYSWKVLSSNDLTGAMDIAKMEALGKEVSMDKAKFGVKYEKSSDPVEFFETKKEAEKRIVQLLDDVTVDKTSVYLFEVGKVWEVERPISYTLKEV